MYGCESWTTKKGEHQRTDAFKLWCHRRLLCIPWTARISNQSILKEINPELEVLPTHWKDWFWSWSSKTLATWWKELTHWKRPWCWERLRARGEEGNRGWNGSMASLTQWTWVWANCGQSWRTEKPGVLQSMELQRVGHNLVTEQQQRAPISGLPGGTARKDSLCESPVCSEHSTQVWLKGSDG